MRWAWIVVVTAVITVIASIVRPEVAHLAFRATLLAAAVAVLLEAASRLFEMLPASRWATGWRPHRRPRPELPAAVSTPAAQLRWRGRRIPMPIALNLANLYNDRLAVRYGLRTRRLEDLPAIESLLSPHAYLVVTAQPHPRTNLHPLARIPRTWLEPLLTELEHL
ncbi:MAG TPA: hypothetical protein VMS14_04815 [Ilumatobacteraceae bacterium]|nr:hypothetical protein [Ilumatobacteraceae bacterium]